MAERKLISSETILRVDGKPSEVIHHVRDMLTSIIKQNIDTGWASNKNWQLFEQKISELLTVTHKMGIIVDYDHEGKEVHSITTKGDSKHGRIPHPRLPRMR